MKKVVSYIVITLMTLCASAQNLYIGTFYVTSTTEEKQYGDGGDKWSNRLPAIYNMFNFEQPDVLGLQSLTDSQLSQITSRMTSYKAAGNILYHEALELDANGDVEDMPEGSTGSWAKLLKDGTAFYVFNVCFSTDANIASSSSSRVVTAIREINTENLPCFIIGDLGVDETNTAYSRLTTKYVDCFKTAPIISAELGTKNNFDLAANHGTERFDFIFASRNVSIKAYGQLQYGYFTQESNGSYKRRLPSTHFPVMAKVVLPN